MGRQKRLQQDSTVEDKGSSKQKQRRSSETDMKQTPKEDSRPVSTRTRRQSLTELSPSLPIIDTCSSSVKRKKVSLKANYKETDKYLEIKSNVSNKGKKRRKVSGLHEGDLDVPILQESENKVVIVEATNTDLLEQTESNRSRKKRSISRSIKQRKKSKSMEELTRDMSDEDLTIISACAKKTKSSRSSRGESSKSSEIKDSCKHKKKITVKSRKSTSGKWNVEEEDDIDMNFQELQVNDESSMESVSIEDKSSKFGFQDELKNIDVQRPDMSDFEGRLVHIDTYTIYVCKLLKATIFCIYLMWIMRWKKKK